MRCVLLFGSSGHASVITDLVEKQALWTIAGYYDPLSSADQVMGYQVFGRYESLSSVLRRTGVVGGIVAIGDNAIRRKVVDEILAEVPEFEFVPAVHPSAQVARECHIGPGTVVMAGAVINSRSTIGQHCIVNTRASVDHDCVMEDFSSLGPNATLAGTVKVGEFSYIGQSACVIHGVTIGPHTVVGAGAVVLKDLPPYVVAHGVPARISRSRIAGEPYLRRKVKASAEQSSAPL